MGLDLTILDDLYKSENAQILEYLRYNPIWYKVLSNDSKKYTEFVTDAKKFLKLTTYDKIGTIKNQIDMLSIFSEYMKNN